MCVCRVHVAATAQTHTLVRTHTQVKFHKSVIKSVAAMSYGNAQAIIDDASDQVSFASIVGLFCFYCRALVPDLLRQRAGHD